MTIEQIVSYLCERELTVSTAESCTGGMLASAFVSVSGASGCFEEGYVTYSNEAKEKNLNVSHRTLTQYGAVSEETAQEMSEGVRAVSHADFGLATTGIAGPDGGTKEKPVGLVYISCSYRGGTRTIRNVFDGDRASVREQATAAALDLLETCILECEDKNACDSRF